MLNSIGLDGISKGERRHGVSPYSYLVHLPSFPTSLRLGYVWLRDYQTRKIAGKETSVRIEIRV